MKFICFGFIDEQAWDALSEEERQARIQECLVYDDELRCQGHYLGGECLTSATEAVTVAKDQMISDGPFAETREVIGGILHLEARDREHAVELMKKHPGLQIGPFEIRAAGQIGDPETEIRNLIKNWSQALERKDAEAMMEHYLEEAVLFDAVPPYKTVGRDAIRAAWKSCFPFFPERFRSEHRDLVVQVDGNCAFAFGVHHFVPEEEHPCGQTWMRLSLGFRRVDGQWKLAHEHVSIPFNPMNDQAWKIQDPSRLETPGYAGCGKESR